MKHVQSRRSRLSAHGTCALIMTATAGLAQVQPGTVLAEQKISALEGSFTGTLDDIDHFGVSVASLGDLDGDGVGDIAVGARLDDDGGPDRGAVWILFLDRDGTVKRDQKISDLTGGFGGALLDGDRFGRSVTSLGDFDGDGVTDLAVGAWEDDDGGTNRGAVWILFLNSDGTVKEHRKISDTEGQFTGSLSNNDRFGTSVYALDDMDGNGVTDLVVGALTDDDGGNDFGAVWILFLNNDGSVLNHQKISATQGGFLGPLNYADLFGVSVTSLGDLDQDGINDISVGAVFDDDGGSNHGALWILFLNSDGTVKNHQKISDTEGGFLGTLGSRGGFGESATSLGDLDADGVIDLAVGSWQDDDGGLDRGAVWTLFLNSDGTVKAHQKISSTLGGFGGPLNDGDFFGVGVAALDDLDGDGIVDLAVGAFGDGDGGRDRGAVWVLFLDGGAQPCGDAVSYCVANVNSTGLSATIRARGSLGATANDMTLVATRCPAASVGLFIYGIQPANFPLGDGRLCVSPFAPGLFRLPPAVQVDSLGRATLVVDFHALTAAGQIQGGETWYFQCWFRDHLAGGLGSNLSSAVQITFCQ